MCIIDQLFKNIMVFVFFFVNSKEYCHNRKAYAEFLTNVHANGKFSLIILILIINTTH